jgi:phosphomevalonate kinase
MLQHLHIVQLPSEATTDQSPADTGIDRIFTVAQLAHCLAQGKVGSGFDVSSAVYGSHIYRRFSPAILDPIMNPAPAKDPDFDPSILEALEPTRWDSECTPFRLPRGLRIVLADVDAGTDTPSFVGKVLKWRAASSVDAKRMWDGLDGANAQLRVALEMLRNCDDGGQEYSDSLRFAAKHPIQNVSFESPVGNVIVSS